MRLDHRFSSAVFLTDHWKYKYLIDVDGMSYSAHFLAFMASESAVMKATVYREFFSDWIQPWYAVFPSSGYFPFPQMFFSRLHYIPISQSYAELYNIHAYFSGPSPNTVNAARSVLRNFTAPRPPPDSTSQTTRPHEGDRRLRQIARAGRQWKKTMTRREDMEGKCSPPCRRPCDKSTDVFFIRDTQCTFIACASSGADYGRTIARPRYSSSKLATLTHTPTLFSPTLFPFSFFSECFWDLPIDMLINFWRADKRRHTHVFMTPITLSIWTDETRPIVLPPYLVYILRIHGQQVEFLFGRTQFWLGRIG
jgi:hypothetical protein